MLISHSHKFIFFHVGKTGGISMREVLQPYAQEPEKFKMRRPPQLHEGQPNPMYAVWESLLLHARARDAKRELPAEVFANYYKFAFVRDPWDWQVSMYHFLLGKPTASQHAIVKELGSFEAYLEWTCQTPNPYPRGITKLQSEMITDANGQLLVDFLGRFETMPADFQQICQRLQLSAELPHRNQSNHRDYRTYYNDRTRQLVADHFAADVALLTRVKG